MIPGVANLPDFAFVCALLQYPFHYFEQNTCSAHFEQLCSESDYALQSSLQAGMHLVSVGDTVYYASVCSV
jgi:trehalose-6-phosphate synthase